MRVLYFDCFSGMSGDMTVAALVDAGADRTFIEQELKKLQVEPFEISWKRVTKCGISALKFDVMEQQDQTTHHHHRHYADIAAMIRQAGYAEQVEALALLIFEKIANAESKIHAIPVEKVHFHEVGAIDSIVDIVSVSLAIHNLQIEQIICAPIPLGSGTIHIDHGRYPVPAPATLEILRGMPIAGSKHAVELTTPTGAGIVAATANHFSSSLPPMHVESIGYGAGTRDLEGQPNVLRVIIGDIDHDHHDPQGHHRSSP